MHESFLVIIIKKYLWETISLAVCLSMVHSAIDNYGGQSKWVIILKSITNAIYASAFFGGVGSYYFAELGLVAGIMIGGLVGIGTAQELATTIVKKLIK